MGEVREVLPAPWGHRQFTVDGAVGGVASWRGGGSTWHWVTPEVWRGELLWRGRGVQEVKICSHLFVLIQTTCRCWNPDVYFIELSNLMRLSVKALCVQYYHKEVRQSSGRCQEFICVLSKSLLHQERIGIEWREHSEMKTHQGGQERWACEGEAVFLWEHRY